MKLNLLFVEFMALKHTQKHLKPLDDYLRFLFSNLIFLILG
jgi:MFS-type transporter involved in bile tolerance (Atg22 family)